MKALVYGLARSGQAVVERLVEQGDTAVVVDATLGNELDLTLLDGIDIVVLAQDLGQRRDVGLDGLKRPCTKVTGEPDGVDGMTERSASSGLSSFGTPHVVSSLRKVGDEPPADEAAGAEHRE